MPAKNIEYKTKELMQFYRLNRRKWDDFYLSERWVFEKIAKVKGSFGHVLDAGCACAGLGVVLCKKFKLDSYTGVEINKDAIEWAKRERNLSVPTAFFAKDVARIKFDKQFDTVVSLSCADWNIETQKIINTCWKNVKPGGYFIISLRLTPGKGINDIRKSYQYINFSGNKKSAEIANYVIFGFNEAIEMIKRLRPLAESFGAYGYWGRPSSTARIPFKKLVFAVFYIKKKAERKRIGEIRMELNMPADLL